MGCGTSQIHGRPRRVARSPRSIEVRARGAGSPAPDVDRASLHQISSETSDDYGRHPFATTPPSTTYGFQARRWGPADVDNQSYASSSTAVDGGEADSPPRLQLTPPPDAHSTATVMSQGPPSRPLPLCATINSQTFRSSTTSGTFASSNDSVRSTATMTPINTLDGAGQIPDSWATRRDVIFCWSVAFPSTWRVKTVSQPPVGRYDTEIAAPDRRSRPRVFLTMKKNSEVFTQEECISVATRDLMALPIKLDIALTTLPGGQRAVHYLSSSFYDDDDENDNDMMGDDDTAAQQPLDGVDTEQQQQQQQQRRPIPATERTPYRVEGYRTPGPRGIYTFEIMFRVAEEAYPRYGPTWSTMLNSLQLPPSW
eukprot:PhM_4_TR15654/c4_g1_i1/m.61332